MLVRLRINCGMMLKIVNRDSKLDACREKLPSDLDTPREDFSGYDTRNRRTHPDGLFNNSLEVLAAL